MGVRKVKDLVVKTGTYISQGQEKGRWENVGSLMQGDDGNQFILLKRTFNPAGINVEPGKDQVLISMFDPDREQAKRPQQQGQQQPPRRELPDDDIPF
jgi:hypothetical protein